MAATKRSGMSATFSMDCHGHFKISVYGVESDPALYESIARVQPFKDGDIYIAVSEYFDGSAIKPNQVYRLTPIDTELNDVYNQPEEPYTCNYFRPDEECTHQDVIGVRS